VILSFNEEDLRNIIETGEYSQAATKAYILRTLMQRREMVARYWLGKVDGLSDFSIGRASEGVALRFHDLMSDDALAAADQTEYLYQVSSKGYRSAKLTAARPEIQIDRETLSAALEHGSRDTPLEIRIWTRRHNATSDPVRFSFDWSPGSDTLSIRRIARGYPG